MNQHNDPPVRPGYIELSTAPRLVKLPLLLLSQKMFEPGANAQRDVFVQFEFDSGIGSVDRDRSTQRGG
jgi:hypothetical protein